MSDKPLLPGEGIHNAGEFMPAVEVARLWRVHARTIRRWAKEGKLPHIKLPSGQMRFSRDEMYRVFREGQINADA